MANFMQDLPPAEKLPGFINTSFKEVGPLVSPDGKTLYFSRQNYPDNVGGVMDYEDAWYSTYNETTNTWSVPVRMAAPINNYGPNSVNFVSLTGDTIVVANKYLKNGRMAAGLSLSVKENGSWSFPRPCSNKCKFNTNDRFNMFLSYNKQILITSQELDDTYGERDIYVSLIHPDNTCTTINLGSTINTDLDEASPYLAPDYKTLYFASKGHHGFGGFDIYVSHRLDETWQNWSEPENLGPVVNTDKDEGFFNFTYNGMYAYFSRAVSKTNSDIYRVSLAGLYSINANKSTSTLAESGLQEINIKNNDIVVDGTRYVNLDQ